MKKLTEVRATGLDYRVDHAMSKVELDTNSCKKSERSFSASPAGVMEHGHWDTESTFCLLVRKILTWASV